MAQEEATTEEHLIMVEADIMEEGVATIEAAARALISFGVCVVMSGVVETARTLMPVATMSQAAVGRQRSTVEQKWCEKDTRLPLRVSTNLGVDS
jgi:hypothetical protein